jgi:hypothetical protein
LHGLILLLAEQEAPDFPLPTMIDWKACQQILDSILIGGALLRTSNDTFFLSYAKLTNRAGEVGLEVWYRIPTESTSKGHCYLLTHYDQDTETGKVYLAFSDTEYVQVLPLPTHRILSAATLFRQEYLFLTNEVLPDLGLENGWPVHENHCFQRILLDHLFQDCWYRHIQKGPTPAYRQLNLRQLGHLLRSTHQMCWMTRAEVVQQNQQSLHWRRN